MGAKGLVIGSLAGLIGIPLKLLFSPFGFAAAEQAMGAHAEAAGNPLLLYIHPVFFCLGFVTFLGSLVLTGTGYLRSEKS